MANKPQSTWIDHIPAIWIEPQNMAPGGRLAIVLNGLSGTKEGVTSYLSDLAEAGFLALSFDAMKHGERTK